jgi:hypothetical protein
MKDYLDKFDDLQDLPVPEEMLGAYVEGKLRGSEFREVQNLLGDDSNVSDLVHTVESDKFLSVFNPLDIGNDFMGLQHEEAISFEDIDQYAIPLIDFDSVTAPSLNCDDVSVNNDTLLTNNFEHHSSGFMHPDDDIHNNNSLHNHGVNDDNLGL